jgi:hypothetical protein
VVPSGTCAASPTSAISPPRSPTTASRPTSTASSTIASSIRAPPRTIGAGQDDRAADDRALLDRRAPPDDGALDRPGDAGAGRDQALADLGGAGDARRGAVRGRVGQDGPRGVVEAERRVGRQQLLVGAPVRGDRPDVAPEALEPVLARAPGVDEPGQERGAEVLHALLARVGAELVERVEQRRGPEDEDLVADDVAVRLVRLVDVLAHAAAVDLHDAVPRRVVGIDLVGDHRDVGAALGVLGDQRLVVQRVHRVRADDHDRVGGELAHERGVAPQAVGRPLLEPRAVVVAEPGHEAEQAAVVAVQVPRAAVGQVVRQRDRG